MECLFSLLFFTFGHFNQVNSNTDKNDCKCLRPAKTVLSESKGSNGRHNQNQITVDSDDRCLQIFQTDRQQHITDSGRENQYEHPVINVTIMADTAAPEKVYRNIVIAPMAVRMR